MVRTDFEMRKISPFASKKEEVKRRTLKWIYINWSIVYYWQI